jgi:hypothetical protein
MGFVSESQVRTRLPAGGKGIRTLGPPQDRRCSRDSPFRLCGTSRFAGETDSFRERDRQFESPSLQRRVSSSTDFCSCSRGAPAFTGCLGTRPNCRCSLITRISGFGMYGRRSRFQQLRSSRWMRKGSFASSFASRATASPRSLPHGSAPDARLPHSAPPPIGLPRKGLDAAGAPKTSACMLMLTLRALAHALFLSAVKTPLFLGRDLGQFTSPLEVSRGTR